MDKLNPNNTSQFLLKGLGLIALIIAAFVFTGELMDRFTAWNVVLIMLALAYGTTIFAGKLNKE